VTKQSLASGQCQFLIKLNYYIFGCIFNFLHMTKGGYIYIITNQNNTTLYVGVTSDLITRIDQHKSKIHKKSFSCKYNLEKLVYFESFNLIEEAIEREKQLKAGSRKKKEDLVNSINVEWKDLYDQILESW